MDPQEVFEYCPRCSTKFTLRDGKKCVCSQCGLVHYINPIPCASVILLNPKGEILLVERKNPPQAGLWDIIGGFVELNESIEEGAIRECLEETGVELKQNILRHFRSVASRYLYRGVNAYILPTVFIADLPEGAAIKPGDDAKSAQFFALKEIPWEQIAFPKIKEILQMYVAETVKK